MTTLTLSFAREKCKTIGCPRTAGVFGVCEEHEAREIHRYWAQAASDGICDWKKPACFRTDREWREYVVAFMLCRNSKERQRNRVDYCRDCTPEFKAEQTKLGKCAHPETVFIRPQVSTEDVVGVSFDEKKKSNVAWENAMLGASGEIVGLPDEEAMSDSLKRLTSPKKKGRPRSEDA